MLSEDEIKNRFGVHKATIEGPNATAAKHSELRVKFCEFAMYLSSVIPEGRLSALSFTELETASMWAHKAIAEKAPLVVE